MREPIQRNAQKGGFGYGFVSHNPGSGSTGKNVKGSNTLTSVQYRCPKYCWGFNKSIICKFGKDCKYIEHCSYCDSTA